MPAALRFLVLAFLDFLGFPFTRISTRFGGGNEASSFNTASIAGVSNFGLRFLGMCFMLNELISAATCLLWLRHQSIQSRTASTVVLMAQMAANPSRSVMAWPPWRVRRDRARSSRQGF